MPINFAVAAAVSALTFALDQLTKYWVLDVLDLRSQGFIDVAPFLNFALARNTGVNFGVFASDSPHQQLILAAFAAAVSLALLIWAARSASRGFAVAAGLIIGGALGNALDRLREGAVMDFLNVDCCGIGNPYAFNVADAAIFLGAVAIALFFWRDEPRKEPEP